MCRADFPVNRVVDLIGAVINVEAKRQFDGPRLPGGEPPQEGQCISPDFALLKLHRNMPMGFGRPAPPQSNPKYPYRGDGPPAARDYPGTSLVHVQPHNNPAFRVLAPERKASRSACRQQRIPRPRERFREADHSWLMFSPTCFDPIVESTYINPRIG